MKGITPQREHRLAAEIKEVLLETLDIEPEFIDQDGVGQITGIESAVIEIIHRIKVLP